MFCVNPPLILMVGSVFFDDMHISIQQIDDNFFSADYQIAISILTSWTYWVVFALFVCRFDRIFSPDFCPSLIKVPQTVVFRRVSAHCFHMLSTSLGSLDWCSLIDVFLISFECLMSSKMLCWTYSVDWLVSLWRISYSVTVLSQDCNLS